MNIDASENARDAKRRQYVLFILKQGDPELVSDKSILFKLKTEYPELEVSSITEVRIILKYLQGHLLSLSTLKYSDTGQVTWEATITSHGVDYLAGGVPKLFGVARDA